jgi:hypothetical protein
MQNAPLEQDIVSKFPEVNPERMVRPTTCTPKLGVADWATEVLHPEIEARLANTQMMSA